MFQNMVDVLCIIIIICFNIISLTNFRHNARSNKRVGSGKGVLYRDDIRLEMH